MPSAVRSALAILLGLAAGSVVNMSLILLGATVVPAPEGVDPMNADSIASAIGRFEAKHFVFPFLAHALGTLAGACVAILATPFHQPVVATVVGVCFLMGGIAASRSIPAPQAFLMADLGFAYLPMAALALWMMKKLGRLR